MLQEIKAEVQSSIAPLLQGIMTDAQTLLRQEIALAKTEIKQEVHKARIAAISLGTGVALALIALILLCVTLVHFISWAFPALETWHSYAIVTGLIAVTAGACISNGQRKARDVNPLPNETIDSMKENAQWLKQKI